MFRILVDDLAFVAADAVLRAADDRLEPASTAAARLDHLGGAPFTAQRRVTTPLDAGAAVVTGGGDLAAPFVLHVVVRDEERPLTRDRVRRALVSAWQRAREWELRRLAAPLVGTGPGGLDAAEAAVILVETFREQLAAGVGAELTIVVEREDERGMVEAVVRRRGA